MDAREGAPREMEPVVSDDIDIIAERGLAPRALGTIAEVFELDVSLDQLKILAEDPDDEVRVAAKRALRCIQVFGEPDSEIMQRVGEQGLYDYVEGVVEYGAAEWKYLQLMTDHHLTAEEVTGLYAVRERIAVETNEHLSGFPSLLRTLAHIGISPWEAANDPDEAVAALYEAGLITDHIGGRRFRRPILSLLAVQVDLRPDMDTPRNNEPVQWVRQHFRRPQMPDDYEEK
jgi:hypothetical protein